MQSKDRAGSFGSAGHYGTIRNTKGDQVNLETLLQSAQEEAKRLQTRLLECEYEVTELREWQKTARKYLGWLKNQPSGNNLTEWQALVVRDALGEEIEVPAKSLKIEEYNFNNHSKDYFSGKADSYRRAAVKVKEFL